ncbi:hypothetical protein LP7551_00991 [Roseibium album]|nr:hypothetical protein LP7551_00991 [Roseibium album]
MGKVKTELLAFCVVMLLVIWQGVAWAEPLTVSWAELRTNRPETCVVFLDTYENYSTCSPQTASARLFSKKYDACTPGTKNLDGQTVRIAGYAHPLEFEFRDVKSFLLIPPLRQDCRHPPPPLPDQVIAVEFSKGMNVTADPVWVTGVLRLVRSKTHIVTTAYTLEATAVVPATIPDVVVND